WTLLGPEDGAKLEDFIRCHEIYLNNLGSRLRDSLPKPELDLGAAFRGLRSPWTAAALENRAIFALQAQGFSALHATDPSLFRSEFAGFRKLLGAKILGIRTLMGETRSVDAFQSSLGRRPEICVRYVMMAKETPG